jgi:hypothetical protein
MPQTVYTLLCDRDLPMALITVPRIIKFLQPDQQLVIVDDGSFTQSTIDTLSSLSPQIKIVIRREREAYVMEFIKDKPNIIAYREKFPFAFKLIDIPLLAKRDSPRYTYTDADIIYLKNCEEYFNREVNTYLRTDAIKLSVRLLTALLKYKWKIPVRFNAGYFCFHTDGYDLDFIEYFLGLPDVHNITWLSEQTCWSLLFGKTGTLYVPDDKQYICQHPYDGPKADTLAIHLIGLKHMVKEWSSQYDIEAMPAARPAFEVSRDVTMLDWVKKSISRIYPIK